MTQTKHCLFGGTSVKVLHKVSEVEADTTQDLVDRVVSLTRDRGLFLDHGPKVSYSYTKYITVLLHLLGLGQVCDKKSSEVFVEKVFGNLHDVIQCVLSRGKGLKCNQLHHLAKALQVGHRSLCTALKRCDRLHLDDVEQGIPRGSLVQHVERHSSWITSVDPARLPNARPTALAMPSRHSPRDPHRTRYPLPTPTARPSSTAPRSPPLSKTCSSSDQQT
mmetsp:Transcript_7962/g.14630  ORF Transcript_7962/g.14630 Transcript_7962/m.14630 type:complete len:220 (+) Transcript_7962:1282-1941(+)